ncbi:MAG: Tad domain-containing protein, partial [Chloroflexales bacterium]|nr:Tad domain-containing protein [Chloroflexales bacterium]
MESRFQGLLARRVHIRTSGQSIPLIALMIVALFGMVGLAVDVGNTYAEQRKVTSGANVAAIAGMDAYVRGGSGVTDQEVYNAIVESLKTNDIDIGDQPGQLAFNALYLGADGKPVTNGCQNVGCGGAAPQNVVYIKVDIEGTVDTFFARVVGQPTLPVDALSYAGLCPPSSSVYPIAIDSATIDGDRFKDHGDSEEFDEMDEQDHDDPEEFGEMGGQYRGYTWRRLYVHDSGVSGSFSWLRWLEDKDPNSYSSRSENALQASLTSPGNLSQGFNEAPWPETNMARPDVYPEKPGQLNIGDWVYGASGAKRSKDVRRLVEGHIRNGTVMILPIYDVAVGNGFNGSFRISRLGAFVMIGYNEKNGSQPYFDLVFLGDARNSVACTTTAVEPETLGLAGTVDIWPEYRTASTSRRPVQYVVVLDVSGSMNYAFDGQGKRGGNPYQCGNSPDPIANANRDDCYRPYNYAWKPQEE